MTIVVVGGGITGLAAAHRLVTGPSAVDPADVVLIESSNSVGGVIRSGIVDNQQVELGPESLVVFQPGVMDLCRELGIKDELVRPDARDLYVLVNGRLRRFPERLMDGAPQGPISLLRSGTLSPLGVLRAGLDLVLPRTRTSSDPSIGDLVRKRLGTQVLEHLIDPLLGGIHGGSCDELSARSLAPQLLAAAQQDRSIILGLRRAARRRPAPATPASSPFCTPHGGLTRIVECLREELAGVRIATGTRVVSLHRDAGDRTVLTLDDESTVHAEGVVLALPAYALAPLLQQSAPDAALELVAIRYGRAQLALLSYDARDIDPPAGASGVLVPASERRTISAITIWSRKWAHTARADRVLVRCSTSHAAGTPTLDDYHHEVAHALGARRPPVASELVRIEHAQAQYEPGHTDRVARIEATLAASLGDTVRLAGAAFYGGGLGACIASGRSAADCLLPTTEHERMHA